MTHTPYAFWWAPLLFSHMDFQGWSPIGLTIYHPDTLLHAPAILLSQNLCYSFFAFLCLSDWLLRLSFSIYRRPIYLSSSSLNEICVKSPNCSQAGLITFSTILPEHLKILLPWAVIISMCPQLCVPWGKRHFLSFKRCLFILHFTHKLPSVLPDTQ